MQAIPHTLVQMPARPSTAQWRRLLRVVSPISVTANAPLVSGIAYMVQVLMMNSPMPLRSALPARPCIRCSMNLAILPVLLCLLLGVAAPAQANPQPVYPWPEYSVLPVFFAPTDWSVASDEVQQEAAAIRSAMLEIQQFYADSLGGRTFRLNDLQVVQANGPKESYGISWNGGNIYTNGIDIVGNVEAAVVAELHSRGFPTPPAQNESGYSVLIFVKGAGGWAGGREFPHADGGWAILGDWCIDSLQGQVAEGEYWWSGRRLQIGAAAHELGHTFGLPHPDAYGGEWSTTVMGHWWNYPNLGFNPWEVDQLFANKAAFFVPEPTAWQMAASAVVLLPWAIRAHRRRSAKATTNCSSQR